MLETGDIFLLYRPKVEEDEPSEPSDVQRFEVVLRPEGGRRLRPLVRGRERLPEVEEHERVWHSGPYERSRPAGSAVRTFGDEEYSWPES